jgi:hypothetical protein
MHPGSTSRVIRAICSTIVKPYHGFQVQASVRARRVSTKDKSGLLDLPVTKCFFVRCAMKTLWAVAPFEVSLKCNDWRFLCLVDVVCCVLCWIGGCERECAVSESSE